MNQPKFTDNRKPWVPAHMTDVQQTWAKHGWAPPSEQRELVNMQALWEKIKEKTQ